MTSKLTGSGVAEDDVKKTLQFSAINSDFCPKDNFSSFQVFQNFPGSQLLSDIQTFFNEDSPNGRVVHASM